MLRTDDLDFPLPSDLIATRPHEPRDGCRLLVVSRSDDSRLEDRVFSDLPSLLDPTDTLVFNTSAVVPARFGAIRTETGGGLSGLFLEVLADGAWSVMLKSNSKLRPGTHLTLTDRAGDRTGHTLTLVEKLDGAWRASPSGRDERAILSSIGATPLPPYILGARRDTEQNVDDELDRAWYQTVYANPDRAGSVAAPTAGLHFTDGLMRELADRGIGRADVTLHVGPGTFKPVQTETLGEHPMHSERFVIDGPAIDRLRCARTEGTRIIPVGTTSVRAIESLPHDHTGGGVEASTDLLIAPGFEFRYTDGLITNFHLPRSTLLALVAALFPGDGVARLKRIYEHAVRERYRFYSYGDAMLILP